MEIGSDRDSRPIAFNPSTGQFSIGGVVTAVGHVVAYDRGGNVIWASDEYRDWVYEFDRTAREYAMRVQPSITACEEESPSSPDVVSRGTMQALWVLVGVAVALPVLLLVGGRGLSYGFVGCLLLLSFLPVLVAEDRQARASFAAATLSLAMGTILLAPSGIAEGWGDPIAMTAFALFVMGQLAMIILGVRVVTASSGPERPLHIPSSTSGKHEATAGEASLSPGAIRGVWILTGVAIALPVLCLLAGLDITNAFIGCLAFLSLIPALGAMDWGSRAGFAFGAAGLAFATILLAPSVKEYGWGGTIGFITLVPFVMGQLTLIVLGAMAVTASSASRR